MRPLIVRSAIAVLSAVALVGVANLTPPGHQIVTQIQTTVIDAISPPPSPSPIPSVLPPQVSSPTPNIPQQSSIGRPTANPQAPTPVENGGLGGVTCTSNCNGVGPGSVTQPAPPANTAVFITQGSINSVAPCTVTITARLQVGFGTPVTWVWGTDVHGTTNPITVTFAAPGTYHATVQAIQTYQNWVYTYQQSGPATIINCAAPPPPPPSPTPVTAPVTQPTSSPKP